MKISKKEYLEKKLSIAKEVLPELLSKIDADKFIADPLKRGSLVYKSSALADALLQEIGYELSQHDDVPAKPQQIQKASQEKTGMINLNDIKKK